MARLPHTYTTQEEIPETLREYYVEVDGKFRIDVAGLKKETIWADQEALEEAARKERENTAAAKETGRIIKAREDDALAKIAALEKDGKGLDKEDIIEFERLKRSEVDLKGQLEESQNTHNSLLKDIESKEVRQELRSYVASNVNEHSIDPILDLHSHKFSKSNGNILTNNENGGNVGITKEEFFKKVFENPIFAKPNAGSGAEGGQKQKPSREMTMEDIIKDATVIQK